MTSTTLRRVRLVYAWVLGALILATGVGFAVSCLLIYRSGDSLFTRESISLHFARIAPLVYACLIGTVGGWVLTWVAPLGVGAEHADSGRVKAVRDPAMLLKKQTDRLNMAVIPEEYRQKMKKERALRRYLAVGAAIIGAAAVLIGLIYCVDGSHFSVDALNEDMAAASRVVLGCGAVALATATVAVLLRGASVARELATVKAAVALCGRGAFSADNPQKEGEKPLLDNAYFLWTVRGLMVAAGILFVILGIFNGGMADVLGKAIRICTECIGLG